MKITICAYDSPNLVSGPNTWLRRILPELRERGVEGKVLFITQPGDCPTLRALLGQGFECAWKEGPVYTEQRVRWFLDQVTKDPPDVFVANVVAAAYYAARWIRNAGIPTVGVIHSDHDFYRAMIEQFALGPPEYRLTGLVCVSRYLKTELLEDKPPATVVMRIPCGVPVPQQLTASPTGTFRLVYVGRLVEEAKRISQVTEALCRAVREVPHTEAVIYGEGPDRGSVERILAHAGPLPVRLAGGVDCSVIQQELLQSHAFVLLSDYEGLPIALMEAMACGVVPICLRTRSGIPELVEQGVTGCIVGDRADEFVAAVRHLRDDVGLWQRLSHAVRDKIVSEYSMETVGDRWMEFLDQLRDRAGRRRSIEHPMRLKLPPVHPALACDDTRRPPWHGRLARIVWRAVKRCWPIPKSNRKPRP
jgi:glycosyltransferase involved in cell wall biosynthesis